MVKRTPSSPIKAPSVQGGGLSGKLETGFNVFVMAPLAVGTLVARPFAAFYKWTNWDLFRRISEWGAWDRNQNTLAEHAEKFGNALGNRAPGLASGFTHAGVRVEEAVGRAGIGPGAVARGAETVLKPLGGNKLVGWLAKLNLKGAQSHLDFDIKTGFETLRNDFSASKLSGHPEARALVSKMSALESRMGSVHEIHGNYDALRSEMLEVHHGLAGLSKVVDPKEYGALSGIRRNVNHLMDHTGNVANKTAKFLDMEKGVATYVAGDGGRMSGLVNRYKNMSLPRLGMNGAQAVFTAINVGGTVKGANKDFKGVHQLYREMNGGADPGNVNILKSDNVPAEFKQIRQGLKGTTGNALINIGSAIGGQLLFLQGGGLRGMMMAGAVQMGASALGDALVPKASSKDQPLEIINRMRETRSGQKPVAAGEYLNLFATIDPKKKGGTQATGKYNLTGVRADYMALYAEKMQMSPADAVNFAAKAGTDKAFAAQITAQVEQTLAEKKAASAKTSNATSQQLAGQQVLDGAMNDGQGTAYDAMPDINPTAKSNNVQNLQARNGMTQRRQQVMA